MSKSKGAFVIAWNDQWSCWTAIASRHVGLIGTGDEVWIAVSDLCRRINDSECRNVHAVPGGWTCPHTTCGCTDRQGEPLARRPDLSMRPHPNHEDRRTT